jgi:hypothetical protein|tara:strand:- start:1228 stop:1464 length:237 start_codon:yes stop_codon:yes gene_type:complete
MAEFNLSDKIEEDNINYGSMGDEETNCYIEDYLHVNDVKEFIKELKKELRESTSATPTGYDIIDKLAGDKLVAGDEVK